MVCMGALYTMHLFFKQFLQQHLKLKGGGGGAAKFTCAKKLKVLPEENGKKTEKNTKTFIFGPKKIHRIKIQKGLNLLSRGEKIF